MKKDSGSATVYLWPKAFYFLYFAALAAFLPFLSLYYESIGLSGRQIGLLIGIMPLVTLIGSALWGTLADAFQKHRFAFLLAIGGAWTAVLALSQFSTFGALAVLVTLCAFFLAPIMPLMDNNVLALLAGGRVDYGQLRLWGAVGWGLAAALLGPLLQRAGLHWMFYSFLLFMLAAFIVAWQLPIAPGIARHAYGAGLRRLLATPRFLLLLSVAFVQGVSLAVFLNYLFLHMETLGANRTLMALSLTVATLSEIPLWFVAGRLLRRWGVVWLLALSLLATAVRAFGYVLMPAPWFVLPISLLHGPSFAFMWAAGVAYAGELAPPGLGATAQGIFAGTVMGLGSAFGALAGGILYDEVGPLALFQIVGILLMVWLVVFVIIQKGLPQPAETSTPDPAS